MKNEFNTSNYTKRIKVIDSIKSVFIYYNGYFEDQEKCDCDAYYQEVKERILDIARSYNEEISFKKFSDYLTIKEAANYIGVSEGTLRNWEDENKIKVYRHPINKYRLYDKEDLQYLLMALK